MSYCDESIELISAALDGSLSPEEQAKLEAHLAQCPDCKALYEDLSRIHQSLLDLPPVEVPEGLTGRIMEAVAAEAAASKVVPLPKPKKSARTWQRWAVTAAAVAVVILGAQTMQNNKSAGESLIAPVQALPSPLVSAQAGLRTYSNENTAPESDSVSEPAETANGVFSAQTQGAETAQTSQEPTPEVVTDQASPRPDATPAPEPSAVPEAPVSSGAVTPRMAVSQKASPPVPEVTSESAAGEEPDEPQAGEVLSPNVFVAQVLPSEEPPLLPEPTDETTVPNDVLTTSAEIPNEESPETPESDSQFDLSGLTEEELGAHAALLRLVGEENSEYLTSPLSVRYPFIGFDDPDGPDGPMADTVIYYQRLSENGKYYLFESCFDHGDYFSTIGFSAVPLDGGEILNGPSAAFWELMGEPET